MKPYLVDVPVKVNIWIRPECQKKQWEVIRKARPSILFIQSDGGRNETEWKAILENRRLIDEGIDWNCQVYKLYENVNNGMYAMSRKVQKLIWSTVDRCIFLEDDLVPAVSYFRFCKELLEKYKDDERIECICGMNHLGKYEAPSADYFFSRQGSIWGIATWKRTIEDRVFEYNNDTYTMRLLQQRTKHNPIAWKRLNGYLKDDTYEGHPAASEFWFEFNMYAQNRLQIIPKVNMISNIGATESSEHAAELHLLPKGIRNVFNMPIYEIEHPLIYTKYVIPDVEYERKRNRIMGYNCPYVALYRKIERFFLLVRYGRMKEAINRIIFHKNEK